MIKNIESLLNIFNYFDGIIVTDKNGIINYYVNFRTDIYNLRLKQIIGKSILEIHPEIKEEDSTIMQVLKTGQPIYDRIEHLTTPHGDCMTNICSTLPILENGEIVGAIDLSRGIDTDVQRKFIEMPKVCNQSTSLYHVNDIVSSSKKVNDLKSIISMVANTDSAVMICGETGTGKEMFAQSIHTSGLRASKPAKINGIYPRKGAIQVGSDADIVIFDPDYEGVIRLEDNPNGVDYNVYEGRKQIGKIDKVFLRGNLAVDDGKFVGTYGMGKFIPAEMYAACYNGI